MKKPLIKILVLVCLCSLSNISFAAPLTDIKGHWASGDIQLLYDFGYVNGTGNDRYQPDAYLLTESWVTLLMRLQANYKENLSISPWYQSAIDHGRALGLTIDQAQLGKPINRYETTRLLGQLLITQKPGMTRDKAMDLVGGFKDLTVTDKDLLAIASVLNAGIIKGKGEGLFDPSATLTRAEAAVMIKRYQLYLKEITFKNQLFYAVSSYQQHIQFVEDLTPDKSYKMNFSWAAFTLKNDLLTLDFDGFNSNGFSVPAGFEDVLMAYKDKNQDVALSIYADLSALKAKNIKAQDLTTLFFNAYDLKNKTNPAFDFDGLVLNFESTTPDPTYFNEAIKNFVKEGKARGKTMAVTIQPHQIPQITSIVDQVDACIVMLHDYESKVLSQPELITDFPVTPPAPITLVKADLLKISDLNLNLDQRNKLHLQINFSTVQWQLLNGQLTGIGVGESFRPFRPTYAQLKTRIQDLSKSYQDFSKYSRFSEQPYIRFINESGLDNVIWYEDLRSIKAKIDLAKLAGFGGVSYWRLGNIPDGPWEYYLDVYSTLIK